MANSFITSYVGLFEEHGVDGPVIHQIQIPLIQRDYAQGRPDAAATTIRDNFLDVLHRAATGVEPVGLDFVYGEVSDGTLEPLDGQQRLTTLFLLHWYLAARTNRIGTAGAWTGLTYATRPSARLFCQRLVLHELPATAVDPSGWITDQPWYLHVWGHDPTIQSMRVMLDAIHRLFRDDDLEAAWARLTDPDEPAVSFHLLSVADMGAKEDLYIKMNSRGKPLTDFENFKARFEKLLDGSPRASEFAQKIDGVWADLFWPMRGNDDIVDDEFLRYFRYVIEICEWRREITSTRRSSLLDRAEQLFNASLPTSSDDLAFLFDAFDAWLDGDAATYFGNLLRPATPTGLTSPEPLALFGGEGTPNVNLLEACCFDLDNIQRFGNPRKLLLYAVLLHRIHHSDSFPRRLRIVRNLIEASENEIRLDRLPRLVADVRRVILDGDLQGVEAFNQAQLEEEIHKQGFVLEHPDLAETVFRLEDHELLRGSTMAFEMEAATLQHRVDAFERAFATPAHYLALTGALVALGEYQRAVAGTHRFGSPEQAAPWRALLTGASRTALAGTRVALGELLDRLADEEPLGAQLSEIRGEWLAVAEHAGTLDWRYYLAKYDAMRQGKSGIYASDGASLGYSLCMLNRQQMNSYYRDPYLYAVTLESDAQDAVIGGVDGGTDGPWFTGYASTARWMRLRVSGVQIRCVADGFAVAPPEDPAFEAAFAEICEQLSLETHDGKQLLRVPQVDSVGELIDTADRIQLGASLLRDLIAAGL